MKAIAAIIMGLVGLLISSCGLLVIGFSFKGSGASDIWSIAVPCIGVGGLLLWGAVAVWISWRKSTASAKAARPPPDTPPSG